MTADATPEQIEGALAAAQPAVAAGGEAAWWTDGAPRVQPRRFGIGALPGPSAFAGMLDDTAGAIGESVGLAP